MPFISTEPLSFTVGESVEWHRYVDDYSPKDGWELSYSFRKSDSQFDAVAAAKGDHYSVRIPASETLEYKAGTYWWQVTVTKQVEWHVIASGTIEVKPNLALLESYDGRSHVKKVLDTLEATLLGKAGRDQMSYSISGRSLSRLSPAELLKWRDLYKAEYVREIQQLRLNQGLSSNNTIKVRFGSF